MKKNIIVTMLLMVSAISFSQPVTDKAPNVKTDYLKKSKTQKTVANIFLVTGSSCVLVAFLIPKGEKITVPSGSFGGNPFSTSSYKNDNIKGTFGGIGILVMLGSIPFYIASHHNKKKAMRLSFENEEVPQLQNNSLVNLTVPALALRISL